MPLAGLAAGLFVAGVKTVVVVALVNDPERHRDLFATDALVSGTLAGTLVWIVLRLVHGRRRRLIEYVRRVADLNHHIRNAMQIIVYQATLSHTDPQEIEQVESAVRRVDAALHEIFPILGDRKSDAPEHRDLIH